jgi:hypothetical protein
LKAQNAKIQEVCEQLESANPTTHLVATD